MKHALLVVLAALTFFIAPQVASAQVPDPLPYSSTSPTPTGAPTATIALAYPCPVTMSTAMLMVVGQIDQSYVRDNDYLTEWNYWVSKGWHLVDAGWSSVAWDYCDDHSRWMYYRTKLGYYLFTRFRIKPDTEFYWRDYVSERQTP